MKQMRWALVLLAVLTGLLMPEFYDWTGADQSRPAPVVHWIGLAMLLLDGATVVGTVWLCYRQPSHCSKLLPDRRFGIWQVLVATTAVAVVVTAERLLKLPLVLGIVLAVVTYAIWIAFKQPAQRWQIATLIVCLWGPFLWIFRWPEFHGNIAQVLLMTPGLPALLPAAYFNYLLGMPMLGDATTPGLFTLLFLILGLGLIRAGQWPAMACSLVLLTFSLFSSFGLQAMVRM